LIQKCKNIVEFIQELYQTKELIPLHEPRFLGNEKKYLNEVIDSTFDFEPPMPLQPTDLPKDAAGKAEMEDI